VLVLLIVLVAWRGQEIEGDDEDDDDWEKSGYFVIVLVLAPFTWPPKTG
jgi:hypothetical protein